MSPKADDSSEETVIADGRPWLVLMMTLTFAIVAIKLPLIWRINVNWDEFYFLSNIYKDARNELTGVFQYAYVHLFGWLTRIGADEMDQVIAGRLVMLLLLGISAVMIARIASCWTTRTSAWVAPLCFLTASPVLQHGASFRADSLLAPLILFSALMLLSEPSRPRHHVLSGSSLGLGLAISLKAVLLAPVFLALILTAPDRAGTTRTLRRNFAHLVQFGLSTCITAGVLLYLHSLTLPEIEPGSIGAYAAGAAQKTLLEDPFMPRRGYFIATFLQDWFTWVLIATGTVAAIGSRSRAAFLSLSLLPILFYRNAYPYYYVVMMAPASILAAFGVHKLTQLSSRTRTRHAGWIAAMVCVPLLLQAWLNIAELRFDAQANQRLTIAAAHRIFPQPVPYIDHSGMLASYRKVNFFMSTWGVESYRRRGVGFMRRAIDEHRPPLYLSNHEVLTVGSLSFERLLPEDRDLIETFYLQYWGPIRVAGATIELSPGLTASLEVPFPAPYRLESVQPVIVNGKIYRDGDRIEFDSALAEVSLTPEASIPTTVRVVYAAARPPPESAFPPFARLYSIL